MPKSNFNPQDLTQSAPTFSLPDELWLSILSQQVTFPASIFQRVMENLIRNPNISSSHLFRADIYYDSQNHGDSQELGISSFTSHLKASLRPKPCHVPPNWTWIRTIVRRLVPRNPNKDKDLIQTVHFFDLVRSPNKDAQVGTLVMQLPHVESEDDMPWYHPSVKQLAIIHTWQLLDTEHRTDETQQAGTGEVSVHCSCFPLRTNRKRDEPSPQLNDRLARTARNILSTICRHGQGQLAGYTKRVHHDQIIPQQAFQDTYTRLKLAHAKSLIANWAEQTDPSKHVFEDLGIAAFLIELWRRMYADNASSIPFPGFVDIGCGNGVLVHVLLSEGYEGWGFDARRRKSWATFPRAAQENLKEMLLVPRMFQDVVGLETIDDVQKQVQQQDSNEENARPTWHHGVFPEGTFIISNHADELTPWTPILASLSNSPFISIPCCSHSFSGAKYRAPVVEGVLNESNASSTVPNTASQANEGSMSPLETAERGKGHASGSLKVGTKGPSAYATLTNWVARLAVDVGYIPEKEMLRIPSTRNAAVVCRRRDKSVVGMSSSQGELRAIQVVADALGGQASLEEAAREWIKRANKLHGKTIDAH